MNYEHIISLENLFQSYNSFKNGKRKRLDVMRFESNLEDNIFRIHKLLKNKTYKHNKYSSFYVNDPKRRHIHKSSVQDRIIHQALYSYLYPLFDKSFIFDSYSCRKSKGTHTGVISLSEMCRKVSQNYTRDCWAFKLDIKSFFASVDHNILLGLIRKKVKEKDILWLIYQVVSSFSVDRNKGIPLGNLTSQVFSNIYLNELDQFAKQRLKVKYYVRYADDFIILNTSKYALSQLTSRLGYFLQNELKLTLHPNKIILRKSTWGIDFLGYIVLPHGAILPRTKTKKRIFKNIEIKIKEFYRGEMDSLSLNQTAQSYFGYLFHANAHKATEKTKEVFSDCLKLA